MKIAKNAVVSLTYQLNDETGATIEAAGDPISYLHGGYDGIFPVVEEALEGKNIGDKFSVSMTADDAFGEYEHELVRAEPRDMFPKEVAVGMQFEGGAEGDDDEDFMLYTVTEITDTEVTVDGNHPLAGKALVFSGTVTAVRAASAEELTHGHVHGDGGHHH
jgi:FKBP-type peptidyl-prolyl cis-trans isomerase SlyD